jgi:Cyclin, N-terminal domain/Cyclin, C-terminal domain
MVDAMISPISCNPTDYYIFDCQPDQAITMENIGFMEDQIGALFSQERSYHIHRNTCNDGSSKQGRIELIFLPKEEWRKKICEWSYRVVDHFRIDREVVAISINLLDRYLYSQQAFKQTHIDSHAFQLAAVSALYLTMKVHAMDDGAISKNTPTIARGRRKMRLSSMVELSRGQFTADDICCMEGQILATLSWKVNPITTSNFVDNFLRLMPPHSMVSVDCQSTYNLSQHVLHDLSRYVSELAVCDVMISCTYLPSKIAMACIFLSMDEFNLTAFPWKVRNEFHATLLKFYNCNSGSTPWNRDDDIEISQLMEALSFSFRPQILMNEVGDDHPLILARNCGLLKPSQGNGRISLHNRKLPRKRRLEDGHNLCLENEVYPIGDYHEDSIRIVSP